MGTIFYDTSFAHDEDAVSASSGQQTVRHHYGSAPLSDFVRCIEHGCFGHGVEGGGRFVEKQDGCLDEFGAG